MLTSLVTFFAAAPGALLGEPALTAGTSAALAYIPSASRGGGHRLGDSPHLGGLRQPTSASAPRFCSGQRRRTRSHSSRHRSEQGGYTTLINGGQQHVQKRQGHFQHLYSTSGRGKDNSNTSTARGEEARTLPQQKDCRRGWPEDRSLPNTHTLVTPVGIGCWGASAAGSMKIGLAEGRVPVCSKSHRQ